jgi:tRNA A37 threonylcarbamoyltransferase TsaD
VIAATVGPGLAACLSVGLGKAKSLVAQARYGSD